MAGLARDMARAAEAAEHLRGAQHLAEVAAAVVGTTGVDVARLRELNAAAREATRLLSVVSPLDLSSRVADIATVLDSPAVRAASAVIAEHHRREAWLRAVRRRNQAFDAALVALGWPPPAHIPATLADTILEVYESREFTAAELREELGDVLVRAYGPRVLDDMIRTWAAHPWLAARLSILREGVHCYREGLYYAAVCTLLPQVEGVAGDALETEPNAQNHAPLLFRGGYCSRAAQQYYVAVLNARAPWRSSASLPGSRNAVLHGVATDYGTAVHALKVLIALDRMVDASDRFRARRAEREARN